MCSQDRAMSIPACVDAVGKLWPDSSGASIMPDDKQGLRTVHAAVDERRLHRSIECAVALQLDILQSTGTLSASHNHAESRQSDVQHNTASMRCGGGV